jgi:glucosamine--fructose-6-phosphate aminotransferase (isomerizing)
MCGIFGYFNSSNTKLFYELGKLSETRGKEASGYFYVNDDKLNFQKFSKKFSNKKVKKSLIGNNKFNQFTNFVGHTRLKTHGDEDNELNNQPIILNKISIVHNGIVVNFKELINKYNLSNTSQLDSEVIALLIDFHLGKENLKNSIIQTLKKLSGEVSISGTYKNGEKYFLYTNTGSIYYVINNNKIETFKAICSGNELDVILYKDISNKKLKSYKVPVILRCTKCILPETVPYIKFNNKGVCNYCLNYVPISIGKIDELHQKINEVNNIIIGFSGGRDSSYGLKYLKDNSNSNFIAVSFDWGMITDLARRNQARVCGKLGIEHIWISADIKKKRKNIKKNLEAWLEKPRLGMLPILMAGDKEWQKQLSLAAKNKKTGLIIQLQSPFEHTHFKYGFAGVKPIFRSKIKIDDKFKKINMTVKLLIYYSYNILLNPKYFNFSLFDSLVGFFAFFFKSSNIISLFDYINYDEELVNISLQNSFSWECDPTTTTTWRIGDGTAPIYNYIYWLSAGFTENDFFRSNQVREGVMTREVALNKTKIENQPRFEKIEEYCNLINLNYEYFLTKLKKIENNSLVKEWKIVYE